MLLVYRYAKIVQTERRKSSLIELSYEVQPILFKDCANRIKFYRNTGHIYTTKCIEGGCVKTQFVRSERPMSILSPGQAKRHPGLGE